MKGIEPRAWAALAAKELKDRSAKVLVTCTVPESSESCQSAGSD